MFPKARATLVIKRSKLVFELDDDEFKSAAIRISDYL